MSAHLNLVAGAAEVVEVPNYAEVLRAGAGGRRPDGRWPFDHRPYATLGRLFLRITRTWNLHVDPQPNGETISSTRSILVPAMHFELVV